MWTLFRSILGDTIKLTLFSVYKYNDEHQPMFSDYQITAYNLKEATEIYIENEGLNRRLIEVYEYIDKTTILLKTEYYTRNGNIAKKLNQRHYKGLDSCSFYVEISEA